ncbi:MAG: alkaline phosphatase [Akkermansiaceae bacterium]|nr:alkaline phosphatase [Armatimonadota bacterium]
MHTFGPSLRRTVANTVLLTAVIVTLLSSAALADPVITRLTPPSRPTTGFGATGAVTARFLPDQRFDLQATVRPDAGSTITGVRFYVDNQLVEEVKGTTGRASLVTTGLATGLPVGTAVASVRAYSNNVPGIRSLRVVATQSNGGTSTASGVFEIVDVSKKRGDRAKNVIVFIGDGMGIAHRTAARMMLRGVWQGKANGSLTMDTFPFTGLVMTSSLNSIVTDSAPGAHCYSTGNKGRNNEEGVFPDDTVDVFDNPRIEHMSEYMFRKYGKVSGIVTTADIFDATPAAFAIHTSNRGAGTGIIDQYLLEAAKTDGSGHLRVLMGGGRRWFLGSSTAGSARAATSDYELPSDIASGWSVPVGSSNAAADVIPGFQSAGFTYAADRAEMSRAGSPDRLLGLFHLGNMNVALDKVSKRRGTTVGNLGGKNPNGKSYVVDDYGFGDQPMLDEMTGKALDVLKKNPNGFTLMVEGASIDKQAHDMDSDRWIMDTIEFDRAIKVAQDFANANPDTLIVVTADHECAGVNIIGASRLSNAELQAKAASNAQAADGGKNLRADAVGVYESAGFPQYTILPDGYPESTDPDYKLLIGYAAGADRYENWLTNPAPSKGSTNAASAALVEGYSAGPMTRDNAGNFMITGHVPGGSAVHTGSDVPLSAFGRGSSLFTGVMDNTDVYFRIMQAMIGGAK